MLAGVEAQITEVGYDAKGYGNYIKLRPTNDPSITIILGHLADTLGDRGRKLQTGDALHVGDTAGHVGSTGNSSGPHLHFGVLQNGAPINPLPWLLGTAKGQASAPLAHDTQSQKDEAAPHGVLPGPNFDALNKLLGFITDPKEWWRILIVAVGVVLVFIGVTGYFAPRAAQVAAIRA